MSRPHFEPSFLSAILLIPVVAAFGVAPGCSSGAGTPAAGSGGAGAGTGGVGNNGPANTIAGGKVTVPNSTWKVVIVLPSGTNDVSRVTTSTRTIAVIVPNRNDVSSDWRTYRVSVDQVEALTGFDFFSNVEDSVENVIESSVDNQLANPALKAERTPKGATSLRLQ
jgi:hypothetical protein